MTHSELPENYRISEHTYWSDPTWGNGGGRYDYYLNLEVWVPVSERTTKFLKRRLTDGGFWRIIESTTFANAPSQKETSEASARLEQTARLHAKDVAHSNVVKDAA